MDRTYRPTVVVLFIVTLGGFAFAFITGQLRRRRQSLFRAGLAQRIAFLRPPRRTFAAS